ncbi:hypothetical protein ACOMHN_059967 [Nucella lapillus]
MTSAAVPVTTTASSSAIQPASSMSTTIVWADNGINTTPPAGVGRNSPSPNEILPVTIGAAGGSVTVTEPSVAWMTSWQFHCDRPTTPCDSMFGMCVTSTGHCNCFNQAFGLRCHAPNEAMKNSGVCQISNPCKLGMCYDDGISAKCSCPDGYYGDHCQHKMVMAECNQDKMVMNVYPYGFSDVIWNYIPSPTTNNCSLERMSLFVSKASSYQNRGWSGFAGEFRHKGDLCAGDATEEYSSVPGTKVYSREVYVFYDSGRHYTDTKVKVVCDVGSPQTTSGGGLQSGLPPPQVNIQFMDSIHGHRLLGPVKVGSPLVVKFSINRVNNANIDDLRVETCTVSDGLGSQNIIVVDHGCVVPPMGRSFQGGQPGTQFLTMVMYRFPHTASVNFSCRIRLCDSVIHDACRKTQFCFGRKRRSARKIDDGDVNGHVIDVDFPMGH